MYENNLSAAGASSPQKDITASEAQIEYGFIGELQALKYVYCPDLRDRQTLEQNFRQKFEALNRVKLSDVEFQGLRDEIVNADIFLASKTVRGQNTYIHEDGRPLHYSLVNIREWCKNDFEVVNQLRINSENSFHRYDTILLIRHSGGADRVEDAGCFPTARYAANRRVQGWPGNGYTNTLLCVSAVRGIQPDKYLLFR